VRDEYSKEPMNLVDLTNNVSELGRYLSEEISTKLAMTRKFNLLERGLLYKAVNELKINFSELSDPEKRLRFGKFIGADYLVIGTITDRRTCIKVNLRIIGVEKGEVAGGATSTILKDQIVEDMMKNILYRPVQSSNLPTPQPSATSSSEPTDKSPTPSTTKQIGFIKLTLKKVSAFNSGFAIDIDCFNDSEEEFFLAAIENNPPIIRDDIGRYYVFSRGLPLGEYIYTGNTSIKRWLEALCPTLASKTHNDITLYFLLSKNSQSQTISSKKELKPTRLTITLPFGLRSCTNEALAPKTFSVIFSDVPIRP
jgi:TolB-like protein